MDPADTERFRLALSSQGNRVGQHERALHEVMEAITNLTSNVALIGGRMDQLSTHLTTLTAPSHAPAPIPDPAPPPPPAASPGPFPTQPREPFILTPPIRPANYITYPSQRGRPWKHISLTPWPLDSSVLLLLRWGRASSSWRRRTSRCAPALTLGG